MIVDLWALGVSNNNIIDFLRRHFEIIITEKDVRLVLSEASQRARIVHESLLARIPEFFSVAVDEVFNGSHRLGLLMVDTLSKLIIGLRYSDSRNSESIERFLSEMKGLVGEVQVVVSDLYGGYGGTVIKVFCNALHQLCTVHAKKLINKIVCKAGATTRCLAKKMAELVRRIALLEGIKKVGSGRISMDVKENARRDWKHAKRGVERLQEMKRAGKDVEPLAIQRAEDDLWVKRHLYRWINKSMGKRAEQLPEKMKGIAGLKKELSKIKEKIGREKGIYDALKRIRRRLAKAFDEADVHEAVRLYESVVCQLEATVTKKETGKMKSTASAGMAKLLRFLKRHKSGLLAFTRDRQAQKAGPGGELLPFPRTSNIAEFIFSFLRPFLNRIKTLQSPLRAQEHFDLFTFFYNMRPFRTGKDWGLCPYELAGICLPTSNYLDLLYPLVPECRDIEWSVVDVLRGVQVEIGHSVVHTGPRDVPRSRLEFVLGAMSFSKIPIGRRISEKALATA